MAISMQLIRQCLNNRIRAVMGTDGVCMGTGFLVGESSDRCHRFADVPYRTINNSIQRKPFTPSHYTTTAHHMPPMPAVSPLQPRPQTQRAKSVILVNGTGLRRLVVQRQRWQVFVRPSKPLAFQAILSGHSFPIVTPVVMTYTTTASLCITLERPPTPITEGKRSAPTPIPCRA